MAIDSMKGCLDSLSASKALAERLMLDFERADKAEAIRKSIPVWLVAGRIADKEALQEAGFAKVICINSPGIIERSHTEGRPAMDPEVAKKRLASALTHQFIQHPDSLQR